MPKKEDFYSTLNDRQISEIYYEDSLKIWIEFEIKNMVEYHNLYLKTDVLLLADI